MPLKIQRGLKTFHKRDSEDLADGVMRQCVMRAQRLGRKLRPGRFQMSQQNIPASGIKGSLWFQVFMDIDPEATVFPVVMYRCQSLNCGVGEDS